MFAPLLLSSAASQAAIDLVLRLAGCEPRIEGGIAEQGMSHAIEADRLMQLGELGRGPERRDGPALGIKLAVADVAAKGSGKPRLATPGGRPAFRLAGDDAAS